MKILNKNNTSGYTIIISLLLIGLLLVLSTGVLNMILTEMKDNRAMGDYIKAYAGAESAQELALLKIKQNGYGYYDKITHSINSRSVLLSDNPTDFTKFKKTKDVFISYDIGSKVSKYNGTLQPLGYDIIPLFYIDNSGEYKVNSIELTKSFGIEDNLVWNIIGYDSGISGKGLNTLGVKKTLVSNQLKYSEEEINDFLANSDSNYLVLFNAGNSELIKYKIEATVSGEYFTKPRTSIISSGEIGNYKQNLETILDNTKFLDRQKYVIYSN